MRGEEAEADALTLEADEEARMAGGVVLLLLLRTTGGSLILGRAVTSGVVGSEMAGGVSEDSRAISGETASWTACQ